MIFEFDIALSISLLKSTSGVKKIVFLILFNFINFLIASNCEVAFIPLLIILFEKLSFLFVKDKKVILLNSSK